MPRQKEIQQAIIRSSRRSLALLLSSNYQKLIINIRKELGIDIKKLREKQKDSYERSKLRFKYRDEIEETISYRVSTIESFLYLKNIIKREDQLSNLLKYEPSKFDLGILNPLHDVLRNRSAIPLLKPYTKDVYEDWSTLYQRFAPDIEKVKKEDNKISKLSFDNPQNVDFYWYSLRLNRVIK